MSLLSLADLPTDALHLAVTTGRWLHRAAATTLPLVHFQEMTMSYLLLAATLLSPGVTDLSKVDRSLPKEPAYSHSPKYCQLVFGPKADFRVWLVQDGDVLYVDRNGNGDLTEKGEQVKLKSPDKEYHQFEVGTVSDGKLSHTDLIVTRGKATQSSVGNDREWKRVSSQKGGPWTWTVRVKAERPADDARKLPRQIGYVVNGDQNGNLLFADRPQDAPIVHLNGPWTLGLQDYKSRLTAGHKTMLQIGVGTFGVGPGTFSFVLYTNDTIPQTVYPVADIHFPAQEKGGEPVKRRYTLKQRC
jgi:hypothetical protein